MGFSGGSVVKNLSANTGTKGYVGLIPGLGRSPGGENGNPLQCSCLENRMDTGIWWATVYGVAKSQTQLSTRPYTHTPILMYGILAFSNLFVYIILFFPECLKKKHCMEHT